MAPSNERVALVLIRTPSILVAVAAGCLGCTTLYDATFQSVASNEVVERDVLIHCLRSFAFEDVSSEYPFDEMISEDPSLLEVWASPTGSAWSPPPYSKAYVLSEEGTWRVRFVPSNGRGAEAKYFANAFSRCVAIHESLPEGTITAERFLDLR